jgi:hypothetical protein
LLLQILIVYGIGGMLIPSVYILSLRGPQLPNYSSSNWYSFRVLPQLSELVSSPRGGETYEDHCNLGLEIAKQVFQVHGAGK